MVKFTRKDVVKFAREEIGTKYRHQGRESGKFLDCVGLLVVIGKRMNYPNIVDPRVYRRTPSATVLVETLRQNMEEIPVADVRAGDIYLMRLGGVKPRHTAIKTSDEVDIKNGKYPTIVHAYKPEKIVIEQSLRPFEQWLVKGFRIRGLV